MKSKISLFNKSEFGHCMINKALFKRNVRECWGVWAGFTLMWVILLPLLLYSNLESFVQVSDAASPSYHAMLVYTMNDTLWNMGVFVFLFAVTALVSAMDVFSYLFKARNSNMMHTYPVSRLSLFATNFVSGLLFTFVPQLAAAVVSMFIGVGFGAMDGTMVRSVAVWVGVVLLEDLFFFSMAVCMLMFVGNIVAVPVLYLILNFLYGGCRMIWQGMISTVCYGVEEFTASFIHILMPVLYMRRHIGIYGQGAEEALQYPFYGGKELAIYSAAAVVFIAIAVIAYKKKHVETAGDVITVGWMKPIFRWGTAVCTSALGALFVSSITYNTSFLMILFSVILIGISVFFLAQMLLDRSIRVFSAKRIRECVVYVVVLCICYIGLDADILGLEAKVPSADEVQSVRMNGWIDLYTKEADEIEWVREMHQQIIDSKDAFERGLEDSESAAYVTISYTLRDGSSLRRQYHIPDSDRTESVPEKLRAYAAQPDVVLRQYFGIHYPNIQIYGGTFVDQNNMEEVRLSETDAQQVYQAIIKDAQAGNLSPYNEETEYQVGTLRLDIRDEAGYESVSMYHYNTIPKDGETYIYLDNTCKNAMEVMKELGYL